VKDGGQLDRAENVCTAPVFVSHATADRKRALSFCNAAERRGTSCWISCRDVAPGENYQEAIVHALRASHAVVLIFSKAANNSDEIKKELSLASRYHKSVMALRIENVEPADAFAYELSTRQWIDAFAGWDKAVDALVRCLKELPGQNAARQPPTEPKRVPPSSSHKTLLTAVLVLGALALALSTWWFRQPTIPSHTMVVRLGDFRQLSADLPPAMAETIREEVIAAFGDDGVIRVSTAPSADKGDGPAYLLAGTVRRNGEWIRVITRLTNERSGTTLWTDSFDYDAEHVDRVPRRIAVDAGNMVHCGLFAASTYRKSLPDAVMSDYMQFCQNSWWSQQFSNPEKALDAARKVAAALPDFSFGWSAITTAAEQVFYQTEPGSHRDEVQRLGLEAADKALALDSTNSEALAQKSLLLGSTEWEAREALLKRAIGARPLFCGCERYLYGVMLQNAGRFADSVTEMRRSTEMLALDGISQFGLAEALLVTGGGDEAKSHFQAAIDLSRQADTASAVAIEYAPETGDYAAAISSLGEKRLDLSPAKRSALLVGFRAMASRASADRPVAVRSLLALPQGEQDLLVARLLGALGANRDALQIIERAALVRSFWTVSALWYPSLRGALNDPAFPPLAARLGLLRYWRISGTKPDVCSARTAPSFCSVI
jgi:tetratricopeptide (TPR) repeat protein